MNVIFTCGGTAGHINPAIAVANALRRRCPDARVLFIGAQGHMEEQLVPKAGYELKCLKVSGMARGKSLKALTKNVKTAAQTAKAISQCRRIIADFRPDVIVGTGGYASFPAIYAGAKQEIPTLVHESNALPGLTTRLAANVASRVLVCFEESKKYYKHPERVEVVGMPLRREFFTLTRSAARKELGLDEQLPLVVSAFGSQGAKVMNETVAELFAMEQKDGFPFRHIHAVGGFGWEWMPQRVRERGVDYEHCPAIDMREYIYNMPTVMAAADLIIGRAGSATCNEIAASGTPCILIPSPNVTNNHQEHNARVLERAGGAVVLLEKDCTAQRLYEEVRTLLADPGRRSRMSAALHKMAILNSAERICDIMDELSGNNFKK